MFITMRINLPQPQKDTLLSISDWELQLGKYIVMAISSTETQQKFIQI